MTKQTALLGPATVKFTTLAPYDAPETPWMRGGHQKFRPTRLVWEISRYPEHPKPAFYIQILGPSTTPRGIRGEHATYYWPDWADTWDDHGNLPEWVVAVIPREQIMAAVRLVNQIAGVEA